MRRGRPPHPELLTPREQEVLSLIREGLTNEQIAARLGISEPGARYHVSSILSKLGVESRQEAARWQEERSPLRRALAVLPFGAALRRPLGAIAPRLAAVALVAGIAVLLAIALGAAVTLSRGGGSQAGPPPPRQEPGPELQDFIALAGEATIEARTVMPDAELYFIATGSGVYTFRFFQPGTNREMAITGPYVNDPAFPLWEHFLDQIVDGRISDPEPLDLSQLQHRPEEVLEAVNAAPPWRVDSARLRSQAGALVWSAHGGRTAGVDCEIPDLDLTRVHCTERAAAPSREFVNLAAEALSVAQNQTGRTLMLHQLSYDAATGLYTFWITEPVPAHQTIVTGPHTQFGQPRWEIETTTEPLLAGAAYRAIEFGRLQHAPADVATAVIALNSAPAAPQPLPLVTVMVDQSFPGSLTWVAFIQTDAGIVRCQVPDTANLAEPASVRCGSPAQPPPVATPD